VSALHAPSFKLQKDCLFAHGMTQCPGMRLLRSERECREFHSHSVWRNRCPPCFAHYRLLWHKLDSPGGSEKRMRLVEVIKGSIRDKKASEKRP
jgi:hypothetical protein